MSAPNVIGLDLSITATGICVEDGMCFTVGGASKLGDRRLQVITGAIEEMLAVHGELYDSMVKVDLVVVEDMQHRTMGNGAITHLVHGAVRLRLMDWNIRYVVVPSTTLKKYATGKGNADKTAMALALYKRAGLELADDNQVDAWWLRCAGLDALGHAPIELPEAQRAALSKVEWPAVSDA